MDSRLALELKALDLMAHILEKSRGDQARTEGVRQRFKKLKEGSK